MNPEAIARAEKIGAEHGRSAASWYFDGNTTRETYLRVLRGIDEGDPVVLDTFPADPLSGEWADGYSPRELFAASLDAHAEAVRQWDTYQDALGDLCTAYEAAYSQAFTDEVERVARYQTEGGDDE